MPVHDWTKVVEGNFHDFHQAWITYIRNQLNEQLLPPDYYAMSEQRAAGREPDVLTLEARATDEGQSLGDDGDLAVATKIKRLSDTEPQVSYIEKSEPETYADKADRIAIKHANGDKVIAFIEIVSPGNKDRKRAIESFLEKCNEVLDAQCHLMLIDILPPGRFDPQGLHWEFFHLRSDSPHGVTKEKPYGLSSYQAPYCDNKWETTAYFEPVALGATLPPMPLFLTAEHYVNVPLEETYNDAWRGVPQRWKSVIESKT